MVHFHSAELVGTCFEFFEMRNDQGHSMPLRPQPIFGLHVEDLGILLEYTQHRLVHSRMESDLRRMQYVDAENRVTEAEQDTEAVEAQLTETQDKLKIAEEKLKATEERLRRSRTARGKERKETRRFEARFKTARYWQLNLARRVDDLDATIQSRDTRIAELEEELEELRKENDDLLPDDEDPMEDMDMEPESEQEDDDLRDDTDADSELVMSEEEDPDEPPFFGDAPT